MILAPVRPATDLLVPAAWRRQAVLGSPASGARRLRLEELVRRVRAAAADPDCWAPEMRFDDRHRFSRLLSVDEDADLWLLTWLPGQRTGLHDHGGSVGAFVVVAGTLAEARVRLPGGRRRRATLTAGHARTVVPGLVHDVGNDGVRPAVTVHSYSPPLSSMTYYGLAGDGLVATGSDRFAPGGARPEPTLR